MGEGGASVSAAQSFPLEEIPTVVAVDREKVLQNAQKLVEKKRYDKAVVEYQKLVADDPKDVRTLLKIGDLYLKMEQYVEAITTYEGVGQFYFAQGFGVKAIAVYKQIREIILKHVPHLEDRFGHVVPRLAEIYTQLGLVSDALASYDEVATRFQRAGRDHDAIDIFRKVVDLDPQNPLPYLRLAEAFVRVRDLDNAIQRFGAAAEILLKLGRRDDALKVVERLLQHRPDPQFARAAAEIYLERGDANDGMAALTKLQIAFKDNPRDLDTLALLARAFDKLGQPAKSIEVQKEAARIAREAGKAEQFHALLTQLTARAPNDEGVRQLIALRTSIPAPAVERVEPPKESAQPKFGRQSMASIDIDADVEVVVEDEAESAEAPFVLRPSQVGDEELDPNARARRVVAHVEQLRRARDYDTAIAVLVEAIEENPQVRELREKLCDYLIEAGDQPEALRQMLGFARWLAQNEDVEGAARVLDEALLLEPNQPEAHAMLRELGYSVGPSAFPEAEYAQDGYEQAYAQPVEPRGAGYDPNAPLPSYDLEEISAVDVLERRPTGDGSGRAAPPLDEPFGDAPLPSFPMDEEATQYMEVPASIREPQVAHPQAIVPPAPVSRATISSRGAVDTGPISQGPVSQGPASLDEEALEEVEFFASHGMFDEARTLLEEQLARLPNHPLLLERRRELEAMVMGAQGESGARAMPRSSLPDDRAFDIAASLDALDALETSTDHAEQAADPRQISVETVFEQFKAGVAAQVQESDASTHYDLGVAYKEMGLFTDAIGEFELASRDPQRDCVCQSMIGMIHMQLGNVEAAIDAFIRGLHASVKTREQELALTYEIGDAYESRGANDQALHYFQRVARIDPVYADPRGSVADRILRLEPPDVPARPASGARAVRSDEDEFDAALDDLLKGG